MHGALLVFSFNFHLISFPLFRMRKRNLRDFITCPLSVGVGEHFLEGAK